MRNKKNNGMTFTLYGPRKKGYMMTIDAYSRREAMAIAKQWFPRARFSGRFGFYLVEGDWQKGKRLDLPRKKHVHVHKRRKHKRSVV